jgi:hypothetical protein
MFNKKVFIFLVIVIVFACKKKDNSGTTTTAPADQHISVLTQHKNNTRSGLNDAEITLTTSNVNVNEFGKLFTLNVDDQVYAQPLVVGDVTIAGGEHNVVYVASVNNTLYAFDGEDGQTYWQKNYTATGMRPPKNTDMTGACGGSYQDFSGNMGIVGTPVIDSSSQTIYFVARSTDGTNFVQLLHAVNIIDGSELPGSPVKITATYSGNGEGNINSVITFDAQKQNQRQALTLLNGIVYVTFSSHCDWGPYHGWILGYNSTTLQQQIVYNDTPDGYAGGIWESGTGMAADNQGNLYVVIGNGSVGSNNDPTNLTNRGESALKLNPTSSSLQVSSYFTPFNYQYLEANDLDYGSMGAFLIPNSNYYFTGCKDGNIFLLDKDNMGGYNVSSNNQVQQNISLSQNANMHCQPAYYAGLSNEFVFIWSENANLRAYPFDRNTHLLDASHMIYSSLSGPKGQSGAVLSVSSNGKKDGTGILWASYASSGDAEHEVSPGILRAFDANDITKELWNNNLKAGDASGKFAKFSSPTIANGHVYLPTFSNQVVVYGLK